MYCYNCDKNVNAVSKMEEREYVIHNEAFLVEDMAYKCPNCGEELIDETLNESMVNIYNKYLSIHNLSLDSFKQIRKSLNLSQELFAKALGWSKKTINRYENGQSFPQKEYLDTYEVLADNKDEILTLLNSQKSKLGDDYYIIVNRLNTSIDLKTINVFLYLLYDNPLYETQIMTYLFASDFLCQKEEDKPLTQLRYVHVPVGLLIDNRDIILNQLLRDGYLTLTHFDGDKVKFYSSLLSDTALFNDVELGVMDAVKKVFVGKTSVELSNWSHNFPGWSQT